ncbi:MAG: hypothetical protein HY654_03065 [Acidobacteria bacterium]|nr:hypothetical protein [Acidobacteriota bacterium]
MRPAPQLDVRGVRNSACGIRLHVVKLEEPSLGASAVPAHEGTPPVVTPPHVVPDRGRDVPAGGSRLSRGARRRRRGTSMTFQLFQEQRQGPIDDLGGIAVWERVAHEGLHAAQLLMGLARDRELNFVALWGERHDRGARRRRRRGRRGEAGSAPQTSPTQRWSLPSRPGGARAASG